MSSGAPFASASGAVGSKRERESNCSPAAVKRCAGAPSADAPSVTERPVLQALSPVATPSVAAADGHCLICRSLLIERCNQCAAIAPHPHRAAPCCSLSFGRCGCVFHVSHAQRLKPCTSILTILACCSSSFRSLAWTDALLGTLDATLALLPSALVRVGVRAALLPRAGRRLSPGIGIPTGLLRRGGLAPPLAHHLRASCPEGMGPERALALGPLGLSSFTGRACGLLAGYLSRRSRGAVYAPPQGGTTTRALVQ